jgi:hypothetical protein
VVEPPPPRKPSQSRFATTVIEQNAGPVRDSGVLVAPPVARKPTPVGMPAPPPPPIIDRASHDDIDHVLELERLERERAVLMVRLQESEQATASAQREAEQLRTPTAAFPPVSVPPAPPQEPSTTPSLMEIKAAADIKSLEKAVVSSRLGRNAIVLGILLALAWNAFNSVRQRAPEQKVAAVQERLQQNERLSGKELEAQVLERERNLRRWRAVECWARQLRGASQRQGLDLQSLPPGGVTALKLGDEDPNKPGPPRFVAGEKCPDFPALPPDVAAP